MIGVYFESWADPWGGESSLAKIEKPIDLVILSFVKPDCTYRKGSFGWGGTGLNFTNSFKVIQSAIQKLKSKGIKVLVGVGGATYQFQTYNVKNVADLMIDLGADGIDIDWEPSNPSVHVRSQFGVLIEQTRFYCKDKLVSAAVFAYGALDPTPSNPYQGLNLPGLLEKGHLLDFINVMAYDGGKGLDVKLAYDSYKTICSKPVLVGFQVGKQGWGDALLTLDDVTKTCQFIQPGDGCFVWAFFKNEKESPNCKEVVTKAAQILQAPKQNTVYCPHCKSLLALTLAK
jgi:chitinase